MINEAQEVFGQSAGTLAVRRRLADSALARLDRIANDSSSGPDVGLARVMAQEKLGELSFLAGRTDASKKYYESARISQRRSRRLRLERTPLRPIDCTR